MGLSIGKKSCRNEFLQQNASSLNSEIVFLLDNKMTTYLQSYHTHVCKRLCQKNDLEVANADLSKRLQCLKIDRDNLQLKLANLLQALAVLIKDNPKDMADKLKELTKNV